MNDFDTLAERLGVTPEALKEMLTEKKPLTVNSVQAATLLGCSREHISRLCRAGKLTAHKVNSGQTAAWQIDLKSVFAFKQGVSNHV